MKKYSIKISVIIPIYNVEKYIVKCLYSVMDQTLKEIELVCVNDGSQDHSMEVVFKKAKADDQIVIIKKAVGCHRREMQAWRERRGNMYCFGQR